MARKISISLDDHFERFVRGQIANGGYGSESEVVRAGLRLLEEQQRVDGLRQALIEGEQSAGTAEFDIQDVKRKARRRMRTS